MTFALPSSSAVMASCFARSALALAVIIAIVASRLAEIWSNVFFLEVPVCDLIAAYIDTVGAKVIVEMKCLTVFAKINDRDILFNRFTGAFVCLDLGLQLGFVLTGSGS